MDLIIETNDGKQLTMTFPKPSDGKDGLNGADGKDGKDGANGIDGISIVSIKVDENNHLICTLSDSSTIDAGEIKVASGDCNCPELKYVEEKDIDKLFEGNDPIPDEDSIKYATKEDIDKCFLV